MSTTLTPFLMFEGRAEEALRFYVSLFSGAELLSLERYGAEGPGPEGTVMRAVARIAGQTVMAIDSPAPHAFTFNPAISIFVACTDGDEIDRLHAALTEGGKILMPLDAYPFARRYAWVADRFGVSWQLSLGAV